MFSWASALYLRRGADDHAVVVSNDSVQLLDGKLVLDVGMVPPLLKDVHTDLERDKKQIHVTIE